MSKTILFDVDGTLFDTGPDFQFIVNHMRAERGMGPIDYAAFVPHIARGSAAMTKYAFNLAESDPEYAATLAEFYQQYMEHMGRFAKPYPGIMELISALEKNNIKWGVVTNRQLNFIPKILQKFGLLDRTQCIVGADSTPHRKPHPGPLLHAAKLLNVPTENCFYVGDFPTDVQAAKAAHMRSIAVTWGYNDGLDTLTAAEPDYLIDHPKEILDIALS